MSPMEAAALVSCGVDHRVSAPSVDAPPRRLAGFGPRRSVGGSSGNRAAFGMNAVQGAPWAGAQSHGFAIDPNRVEQQQSLHVRPAYANDRFRRPGQGPKDGGSSNLNPRPASCRTDGDLPPWARLDKRRGQGRLDHDGHSGATIP